MDWSDPRRFERLVDAHGGRVHAFLARRAGPDADDLLAEVWVAAYAARHRFDPVRGDVGGWLFGIARNVLAAHWRDQRRRRADVVAMGSVGEDWAAVDERLDAVRVAGALRSALRAMPADERDVLLLVAWEQLTPTEAAGVLGIPAGTARSRLHRARSRLTAPSTRHDSTDPEREVLA